jgi:flagellar motor switch protein FliN/FliY
MNDTTGVEENENADDLSEAMSEQATVEAAAEDTSGGEAEADWGDALEEQASQEAADNVEPVPMQTLTEDGGVSMGESSLDVILDIPVNISMRVGTSKISIRNLLKLNQGSVVELERLAGEPLDVLVNGTLIAHGEVVVVNEKYGIRLTDVISAAERIENLK